MWAIGCDAIDAYAPLLRMYGERTDEGIPAIGSDEWRAALARYSIPECMAARLRAFVAADVAAAA